MQSEEALAKKSPARALSNKNMQIASPRHKNMLKKSAEQKSAKLKEKDVCFCTSSISPTACALGRVDISVRASESTIVVGTKSSGYAIPNAIP